MFDLNIPQTVFAIFYAFAWGSIGEVQPQWKAFDSAAFRWNSDDRKRCRRFLLASLWFNVLPIVFFVFVLVVLDQPRDFDIRPDTVAFLVLVGSITPAAAHFAFYRFWLCCISCQPGLFYYKEKKTIAALVNGELVQKDIDDAWFSQPLEERTPAGSMTPLQLPIDAGVLTQTRKDNVRAGVVYLGIAFAGPLVWLTVNKWWPEIGQGLEWLFIPREPAHFWAEVTAGLLLTNVWLINCLWSGRGGR